MQIPDNPKSWSFSPDLFLYYIYIQYKFAQSAVDVYKQKLAKLGKNLAYLLINLLLLFELLKD